MRSLKQAFKPATRNGDQLCKFLADRLKDTDVTAAAFSVHSEAQRRGIEAESIEEMPRNGIEMVLAGDAAIA